MNLQVEFLKINSCDSISGCALWTICNQLQKIRP